MDWLSHYWFWVVPVALLVIAQRPLEHIHKAYLMCSRFARGSVHSSHRVNGLQARAALAVVPGDGSAQTSAVARHVSSERGGAP